MTTTFSLDETFAFSDCSSKINLDDLLSELTDDILKDDTGKPAPKMDPKTTRMRYRMGYVKTIEQVDTTRLFLEGPPYIDDTVSVAPFKSLKLTSISKLSVNVRAKGSYLLARVIEIPTIPFRVSTIIEDHTGDVFNFCVYNFVSPDVTHNPDDVLPVGSVFILKEPLLILPETGRYTIRSNSPSDIIVLFKHHKLYHLAENINWKNKIDESYERKDPTTSAGWMELANDLFKKDMFFKSLEAYFMALRGVEDTDIEAKITLYTNISMVYMKLQSFESALTSAKRALELSPNDTKSLFIAGRAHYDLRQYKEASQFFEKLLLVDPNNNELSKCKSRLEEHKGNVHVYKTFFQSILKPKTDIDCADYTGPIKIIAIPGKGRGMVATEDIKPGTLLSVSKALTTQYYGEEDHGSESREQTGMFGSRFGLLPKLTQLALKNPNTYGCLIFSLAGKEGTIKNKIFCDQDKEEVTIDTEHIYKIIETNYFALNSSVTSEQQGIGVFHSHSFFNHDCLFNSWLQTYNDVMFIRAVKFIDAGEEITITYNKAATPFLDRERSATARRFQCLCSLCELDRKDGLEAHEERRYHAERCDALWLEYRNNQNCEDAIAEMTQIISELEQTYTKLKRYQLRYSLCIPHTRLAAIYLDSGQAKNSMNELEMALNSLGLSSKDLFQLEDYGKPLPAGALFTTRVLDIAELAALSCVRHDRQRDAKKWLQVLLCLEKMCTGGNIHMIREKYKIAAFREIESNLT